MIAMLTQSLQKIFLTETAFSNDYTVVERLPYKILNAVLILKFKLDSAFSRIEQ